MSSRKSVLDILTEQQERLISTAQLLSSQASTQKEISELLVKGSKDLTSELRLLSLVRAKIIKNKIRPTEKIISSPTFRGLQFSKMEYFPPFINPNLCNHYTYLCSYMRKNPETLAKILFEYSIKNPLKTTKVAYSLFLALYQQGWCIEEDLMLFEVLTCMADLQFSGRRYSRRDQLANLKPYPPRQLNYSLDTSEAAVSVYLPFITFSTSYLFNGASFAYLQTSLSPIILKLHSLSYLYDLRTTFETLENGQMISLANFSYWKIILMYAKQVLHSLEQCLPLLPPSTFGLMAYLKSLNVDLFLVFFEAFINRALDSPAILGLLSWHPSHENWNPSKDIADIFRTKSLKSLPSKHLSCLAKVLMILPEYSEIDISHFLDLLILPLDTTTSYMISEAELLSTNPH
ncbi:hypothetical protein GPJ56_010314 [Histomonas meleagridis]|uniref:uncharacterized protein n=1 Tax=Histomonas meleagridis TaxID=135588 RepID=UPI00355997AE|nr:hypothetical protein GPJ56_010314 [Histomonas meleagridis]KAH0797921.1 hypothetical protein GO595_009550 [Histomonas meleagridis]